MSDMKRFLTVDQSFTHTAWIYWDNNEIIDFGVLSSDKSQLKYQRAEYIANELLKVVQKYEPEGVVIEQIAFGGIGNAAKDLAGLLYTIIVCLKRGFFKDYHYAVFVTPTAAKKVHTGNGKASKKDMLDAVPKDVLELLSSRYKKTKGLYDLADAYAFKVWYTSNW